MVNVPVLLAMLRVARRHPMPKALPAGDWQGRREAGDALGAALAAETSIPACVRITPITMIGTGGRRIPARVYRVTGNGAATGRTSGACVVYVHGGGMFMGTMDAYDGRCATYAEMTGMPVISVDYRLAPEHPYPAAIDDVIDAVHWVVSHADELDIDPGRIGIAGDSAGGGIAAGVALRLRDESEPVLACQLLVYPMLDDRTPAPQHPSRLLTWTADDNATGWGCLLGSEAGGPRVSAYAAPARAEEVAGLPPAFIEGCTLDLFCDEDQAYARRLAEAGVEVEWHLRHGVPHGYEVLAPRARIARMAWRERADFLRRHLLPA